MNKPSDKTNKNSATLPKATLNLLHIEDDAADAFLIRQALGEQDGDLYNYNVHHTTNITRALEKLKDNNYSAILLDWNLPDGSGIENIQSIKKISTHTPIIVVTSVHDEQNALNALKEGAQEYIVKAHSNAPMIKQVIQSSVFRKQVELDLAHKAHHDPLTGLPNRAFFENAAWTMLQQANKDHELVIIEDQGHYIRGAKNWHKIYNAMFSFLETVDDRIDEDGGSQPYGK